MARYFVVSSGMIQYREAASGPCTFPGPAGESAIGQPQLRSLKSFAFTAGGGSAIGAMQTQVEKSVREFKHFIEECGVETGAWRGEVHDGQPRPSA